MAVTVKEMVNKLGLRVFSGEENLDRDIAGGYASDLLSDVMGFSREGEVWITLQTHKNVVAIASLKELAAIILVKGNTPDDDTISMARKERIPLLGTGEGTFEIVGKIYKLIEQ